ncbi:CBS domain containing protein [Ammonifex degensii KC4]|uniref:CBS domain containing protein n=1 Tax=Ammonifex degensii (strain DSM 10501 / KC4) TaxID=429009 RepID=C9RA95_AMMDK|nr:CBS domain-containing protein [Ammonifex degensii]ACX51204.1 CBS domain containing protein [Ammonifex degensii KC4]
MFVRDCMTANPITITKDTPIFQALEIINKHKIRHLPVVQDGKLIGIVTERGLLRISPSPASTLSVYELNYILAKLTVAEAMVKNPITTTPDTPIEEAALVMREHKIGCLPVLEKGQLVGIITQTDMVEALVRLFNLRKAGSRLVIEATDRIGVLAEITSFFREKGISIRSLATLEREPGVYHLTLRLNIPDARDLARELESMGYKIISVS